MKNNNILKEKKLAIRMSIVLVFFQFSCTSCNEIDCPVNPYSEELEYELTTEKRDYSLKDTIWIQNKWSTEIKVKNSDSVYNVKNGIGYIQIILVNLKKKSQVAGIEEFNFIEEDGIIEKYDSTQPERRKYEAILKYFCGDIECSFKLGIIPRELGSYCLTLHNNSINRPDTIRFCNDQIRFNKTIPKVKSLHKEILIENDRSDICLPHPGGGCGYIEMFRNETTFCFNVK